MKLLVVTGMDPYVRSVATVCTYVKVGRSLGHEVVLFGEPHPEFRDMPFTLSPADFDYALFVLQIPNDFPDMPHLARLLDAVPRERRIVLDLWGRYNETIRIEHDFNHLEKVDGHQGWEWIDALHSVSGTILQPTVTGPRRADVRPFLFHAFDASAASNAAPSSQTFSGGFGRDKPYGILYVGNNWQRWEQIRRFLAEIEPVRARLGPVCLAGWDWDKRPDWAEQFGIRGIDVDPEFLAAQQVATHGPIRFDEVTAWRSRSSFCPVFHRPLFRELGFVTHRTFESFCAETIPLLMLPREQVEAIYGPAAVALMASEDPAAKIDDIARRPAKYWEIVQTTRAHLAREHSIAKRFRDLETLLKE